MNLLREYEKYRLTRLPIAPMAENVTYCGPILSADDAYFWCSDLIEHEGRCHLFATRWTGGYEDWPHTSSVLHFSAPTPEGPYTYCDTPLEPGNMPAPWQMCAHNPQIFCFDGTYVLLYITFDARLGDGSDYIMNQGYMANQAIAMMTAPTPDGPWTPAGEDGVVLRKSDDPNHWTYTSCCGCNNPTMVRREDGSYTIFYKCGTSIKTITYGAAHAPSLCGPYTHTKEPVMDNLFYIEDAKAFTADGVHYLVTTDNFGTNTGIFGALILWEEKNGRFTLADASIAFGRLCDYTELPPETTYSQGETSTKLERPGLLIRDGKCAYLTGCTRASVLGTDHSEVYLFKLQ